MILTHYRDERIDGRDLDEAEQADKILSALQEQRTNSLRQDARSTRESQFTERLEAARENASKLERDYQHEIQLLEKEHAGSVARLADKHRQERELLAGRWDAPDKWRLFNRASPALMSMRTQNFLMLKARRYDEQRVMEKYIHCLEQFEIDEQSRNMLLDYETQMDLLLRRQKQEMDALTTTNEGHMVVRKRARDRDVSAAKQRIQNIENELRMAQESRAFVAGYVPRGRQTLPTSRGRARTAPMNMIQICTIKLPPLLPSQARRPGAVSSSAVIKRK
jgi:hypothetical protein